MMPDTRERLGRAYWKRFPLCVLDTETTGLPEDPDARVVELGATIVGSDGHELASWSSLVRPDVWPADDALQEALEVNGLRRAELQMAPPEHEIAARFVGWWIMHGRPAITSWRLEWDRQMLARSMPSLVSIVGSELGCPGTVSAMCSGAAPYGRWAGCAWRLTREVLGGVDGTRTVAHLGPDDDLEDPRWPSLRRAAELLEVPVDDGRKHRALYDAQLAAQVAVRAWWAS